MCQATMILFLWKKKINKMFIISLSSRHTIRRLIIKLLLYICEYIYLFTYSIIILRWYVCGVNLKGNKDNYHIMKATLTLFVQLFFLVYKNNNAIWKKYRNKKWTMIFCSIHVALVDCCEFNDIALILKRHKSLRNVPFRVFFFFT